jgi:hypothetical protein
MTISYINVFNSNERFNYASIGFVVFGSLALLALWSISWPFYLFFKKFIRKEQV